MDRNRRRQVAGAAAVFLVFLVFASGFLFYQIKEQERELKRDLAVLISRHPELEHELLLAQEGRVEVPDSRELEKTIGILEDKYHFSYRESKNAMRTLKTGAVVMAAALAACCMLVFVQWRADRREKRELKEELRAMYVCLNRYSTGVFDAYRELPRERMRDLGLCVSGLRSWVSCFC